MVKKIVFGCVFLAMMQVTTAKQQEIAIGQDPVPYTLTITAQVAVGGNAQGINIEGNTVGLSKKVSAFYIEAFDSIVCSTGEVFRNPFSQISAITGTPAGLYYRNYIGSAYPKQKIKNMPGAGKRIDYFVGKPKKKVESGQK